MGLTVATALLSIFAFPRFNRFVEQRVLGMPLPPTKLIETYSARIATSLVTGNLIHLLRNEVLPSLFVRQSALVQMGADAKAIVVYSDGVDQNQMPAKADLNSIISQVESYPLLGMEPNSRMRAWIRLVFPLYVEGQLLGIWFLGDRDPDDRYAQSEIAVLQTLAYQVALALVNISQAERLRAIFEANIERVEEERTALARALHDEVLNQLAVLAIQRDTAHITFIGDEEYQALTNRIRRMVSGLRPAILTYGLGTALDELIDDLCERAGDNLDFQIEIKSSAVRYHPRVEEHLYRIVQQACENAVKHAQASVIHIYGQLEPNVVLTIEDNEVGFPNRA